MYGGVIVKDKNKTQGITVFDFEVVKLYIVALEPKPPAKLMESREYRVIENMVERSVMGS